MIEDAGVDRRQRRLRQTHPDTLSSIVSLARTLGALDDRRRLLALLRSLPPAATAHAMQAFGIDAATPAPAADSSARAMQ